MTVMLTLLSAESREIAVIPKTATGFKVRELLQGRVNYEFEWEIKCVRLRHPRGILLPDVSTIWRIARFA